MPVKTPKPTPQQKKPAKSKLCTHQNELNTGPFGPVFAFYGAFVTRLNTTTAPWEPVGQ